MKKGVGWQRVNIGHTLGIAGVHILAVFVVFPRFFSWTGVELCAFLFWLSIWVGIGLCYHRLLTHSGFRTSRWFRYLLTLCGTLSWEGGPIKWVGKHRVHHRYADQERDLHSPIHGFEWAHMFWVFFRTTEEENDEICQITGDLQADPGLVFLNKFFWVTQVVAAALLYTIGSLKNSDTGWSYVIWGIGVRTVLGYHITWCVNSINHIWGYRNFETPDFSTNNCFVGYISGGEGWHNNHHYDQKSALHGGRQWWEFDATYQTIRILERVGLVRDVVGPKKKFLVAAR